jgi:hypothetical protein
MQHVDKAVDEVRKPEFFRTGGRMDPDLIPLPSRDLGMGHIK